MVIGRSCRVAAGRVDPSVLILYLVSGAMLILRLGHLSPELPKGGLTPEGSKSSASTFNRLSDYISVEDDDAPAME